jgi:hypothetical protein
MHLICRVSNRDHGSAVKLYTHLKLNSIEMVDVRCREVEISELDYGRNHGSFMNHGSKSLLAQKETQDCSWFKGVRVFVRSPRTRVYLYVGNEMVTVVSV